MKTEENSVEQFQYDVFLSCSPKDNKQVSEIAHWLREKGLKIWFDEWIIKKGEDFFKKIEEGLEKSRILILFISNNTFDSDWIRLEGYTFRFRDPMNNERGFIPVKLDDVPVTGSISKYPYIDLNSQKQKIDLEYSKLFRLCSKRDEKVFTDKNDKQKLTLKSSFSLVYSNIFTSVAFSPDGKRIISGSYDKTIRLWDIDKGQCLQVFEGHTDSITSVAFSPDGNRIISGSRDRTIRLWDVTKGQHLQVFKDHTYSITSVAFSPDGKRIISGSYDKTIRLWDVTKGECLRVFEGHTDCIYSVAFSPDGKRIISGSYDKTIRLWDVTKGECLRVFEGHTDCIYSVAFSPDGKRIISGSRDKTIRLWDVTKGECLRVFEGHSNGATSVAFSPDGKQMISGSYDKTIRLWDVTKGECLRVFEGHTDCIQTVAFSPDGKQMISGSDERTIRLWDLTRGQCLRVFEGHTDNVTSVALSLNRKQMISGSYDKTIRLWDATKGECLQVFKGNTDSIYSVAFSPDGKQIISGGYDQTIRLWDIAKGQCLRVFKGHTDNITSVAFSPDGKQIISGSSDKTIRLWDIALGQYSQVFEGHTDRVTSVAFSPGGKQIISGSSDKTIRLWDIDKGQCLGIFEGHTDSIYSVAFSPDGKHIVSGGSDKTIRLWDIDKGQCLQVFEGSAGVVKSIVFSKNGECIYMIVQFGYLFNIIEIKDYMTTTDMEQLQYTNAKVLLVGEQSTGKTALSMRIALNKWHATDSTVGAWATQLKVPLTQKKGIEREIWLWDFGGQADQQLIHQLYMDETSLAVLVFDGQKDDLLEKLNIWERRLPKNTDKPIKKILVQGRTDAGGLRVSRQVLEDFAGEHGYTSFIQTSAKENINCEELRSTIISEIQWNNIPWMSTPLLFKTLKDEIIKLKDEGKVLLRFNELRDTLRLRINEGNEHFNDKELKAVLGLLSSPGIILELTFGNWILLRPEILNTYAQAVINTIANDNLERGFIEEDRLLNGNLDFNKSMNRLDKDEERFVLLAMHQMLIQRCLCIREQTEQGPVLIFPSFFRRVRPAQINYPPTLIRYKFNGYIDDIYASLVVKLHRLKVFDKDQLWHLAANFKTNTGQKLGIKVKSNFGQKSELDVYFDPGVSMEETIIFSKYIHEHLIEKGQDIERHRYYICPYCKHEVKDTELAMKRLNSWMHANEACQLSVETQAHMKVKQKTPMILCQECEGKIQLWDVIEQCFSSQEMDDRVRSLREESEIILDNESKERVLVGDVYSTVASADQLCRELTISDFGVDMEIEFRDDNHIPLNKKVYLQLKSGDSYIRTRKSDGAEIFTLKNQRHFRYFLASPFLLFLVLRGSDGEIRWMEIREWLKRESENGKKIVKNIEFIGEKFDVTSVRKWRDKILAE
jgi:small GTP-binding protein